MCHTEYVLGLRFLIVIVALCALQCGASDDAALIEVRCMPCDPVVIDAPMTIERNGKDLSVSPPWVQWRYGIRNNSDRDVVIVNMSVMITETGAGVRSGGTRINIDPNAQLEPRICGTDTCPAVCHICEQPICDGVNPPEACNICAAPRCTRCGGVPLGSTCQPIGQECSGNVNSDKREVLAVVGPNSENIDNWAQSFSCDGEFVEEQPYFLSNIGSKPPENARPGARRVFFAEGFLIGWFEGPARDANWKSESDYDNCNNEPHHCRPLVDGRITHGNSFVIPTRRMSSRFRFSTQ